ncbi:hypothetical protein PIB30_087147 [Stylosanthes scabra]|uniref:RNA polymerase sigma-70 region 2 domain-containing protein n=1 Tax=Stylosanthes scabra TaxID=79078 RepID=A0ABU6WTB8_9FABA|nr:hypothetical protein [Stylosanthes scabra]
MFLSYSRSLESSYVQDYIGRHRGRVEEHMKSHIVNDYVDKVFVQSSKKTEKKTRTKRAQRALVAKEDSCRSLDSKANLEGRFCFSNSSVKRASSTKNRKIMIARREAEMSKAVKVLAELERTRKAIEKDTNQVASLRSWAEASGVDEKVLLQQLHYGRYCQDELIRSTHSLVLYLSRKYRGLGIALEDLLQAGYEGVFQGAERFDRARGYRCTVLDKEINVENGGTICPGNHNS